MSFHGEIEAIKNSREKEVESCCIDDEILALAFRFTFACFFGVILVLTCFSCLFHLQFCSRHILLM